MLCSIKYYTVVECFTNLVDVAFWHLLVMLFVVMILWRLGQNNQGYSLTPLLTWEEDYSSDEDVLYNDARGGMQMRGARVSKVSTRM